MGCAQSLIGQGGDRVCANHLLAVDCHARFGPHKSGTKPLFDSHVGMER